VNGSTRRQWLAATGVALATPWWAGTARADLPALIAAIKPSVLPVGTFSATASPRFGFRGSGFVVGDGTLVATNFHVLPEGNDRPQMMVMTDRSAESATGRRAAWWPPTACATWRCCAWKARRCRRWRWPMAAAPAKARPWR
jgi:hypothetical protein